MTARLRSWRMVGAGLLLELGVGGLWAQPAPELAKYATPPSIESLVTIDGVRIDGSLALGYDLGMLQLGADAGFPFRLEHRLETDIGRRTRSVWSIPELYGVIAPLGRNALRWRLFGAGEAIVPAMPPGPEFRAIGMGYAMQRTASGDFVFRNALGWDWVYRDWVLVAGHGPNGLELIFQVQGGRIVSMEAKRYQIAAGNLEARYDDAGRLMRLRIGNRVHEFEYEGDSQRIWKWESDVAAVPVRTEFSYENELLVGVRTGEVSASALAWVELPAGRRSDCKWPHSVGLARTERYRFSYDHGTRGYVLRAQPLGVGLEKSVTLNTNRGLATIAEGGLLSRRISFGARRDEPEAGRLMRMEDGEGKVLERYEYDASGRVVRAWPGDGKCIEFTYDRAGALLGATERSETAAD